MGADSKATEMQNFDDSFSSEQDKKSKAQEIIDEIIRILKKLWDYFLCCVTCGCRPVPGDPLAAEVYETELMEEEREAVHNLLKYLDSGEDGNACIKCRLIEQNFR